MLGSTPGTGEHSVAIKDIAELLLAGVEKASGIQTSTISIQAVQTLPQPVLQTVEKADAVSPDAPAKVEASSQTAAVAEITPETPKRPKWNPKQKVQSDATIATNITQAENSQETPVVEAPQADPAAPPRKKWAPKKS